METHTTHITHNASKASSTRSVPTRLLVLVGLVMALVASISAATITDAHAADPYVSAEVSASGNLTVRLLTPYNHVQLHQNIGDGFAIWVSREDATGQSQIVETHNVTGVTGDVTFIMHYHSQVRIGEEGAPANLPGDLRFRERESGLNGLGTVLTNTHVAGKIVSNNTNEMDHRWQDVTVGDDVVVRGAGYVRLFMRDVEIADRLRIAKRNAATDITLESVAAGTTSIIADSLESPLAIDDMTSGTVRIRARNGDGIVRIYDSVFSKRLVLRTGGGNDQVALSGVEAFAITVATGGGDDHVYAVSVEARKFGVSKITGNGGFDRLTADGSVDAFTTRQFEVMTEVQV